MTRRDFELIARVIRERVEAVKGIPHSPSTALLTDAHVRLSILMADALGQTNPRFDRQRFLNACYGKEGQ